MRESRILDTILFLSGLIAVLIGGALLINPVAFEANAGIEMGGDVSLLSELRAPGGALLTMGVLILLGAFVSELSFTSTLVSTLLYLAYGLSRAVGLLVDGRPADSLVAAMVFELAVGVICLFALTKYWIPNLEQGRSARSRRAP